jgi:hypothetical protein
MFRRPMRLLVPTLALIALVVLFPALTTAAPRHGEAVLSPAEHHEATHSLFAQLRGLLSTLWKNGSGLEPNGAKTGASSASGTSLIVSGDTGSILDPNG